MSWISLVQQIEVVLALHLQPYLQLGNIKIRDFGFFQIPNKKIFHVNLFCARIYSSKFIEKSSNKFSNYFASWHAPAKASNSASSEDNVTFLFYTGPTSSTIKIFQNIALIWFSIGSVIYPISIRVANEIGWSYLRLISCSKLQLSCSTKMSKYSVHLCQNHMMVTYFST